MPICILSQQSCKLREDSYLTALIVSPEAMVPLRLTRHDEHADEIIDPAVGQSLYVQIHLRSRECEGWIAEHMHLFLAERERLERKVCDGTVAFAASTAVSGGKCRKAV